MSRAGLSFCELRAALVAHWPEYLMEAFHLGAFMVSACVFGALLWHPASPLAQAVSQPLVRQALMGLAMAATNIAIVYSPWGKQSGAHFNPALTFTFLRLKRVQPADALFYALFQVTGGIAGTALAAAALGEALAHPQVAYVQTLPGPQGVLVAFVTEAAMAFGIVTVVLRTSSHPRLGRFTGLFAACLVALYIALLSPLSGMSMNPARTLASAVPANVYRFLWLYCVAPLAGMQAAALLHVRLAGSASVGCAKLHHQNRRRCIFCASRVTEAPLPHPNSRAAERTAASVGN
jgi:aquaporin Z